MKVSAVLDRSGDSSQRDSKEAGKKDSTIKEKMSYLFQNYNLLVCVN